MGLGRSVTVRLGAAVVLAAVFGLGTAVGIAMDGDEGATSPDDSGDRAITAPREPREPPNEWIIDRLDLSVEQRAQVDSVVLHYGSRMSALQKEYRPQYRAIVDSTDGALKSLLDGGQLVRYDSLSAAAARWRARNRSDTRDR